MNVDHNLINWKEMFQLKNSILNLVGVQFHKMPIQNWLDIFNFWKNYSAVTGSIIVATSLTEFAGNPPCLVCSRIISSFGAL